MSFFKIVITTTQEWMVLNTSWVKVLWSSHIHYHSTVTKDRQDDRAFSMYGCSFLFLHLLLPCASVGIAATEWHTWIRSTHHPPASSTWSLHHFGARLLCPRGWPIFSVFLKLFFFSYFCVFCLCSNSLVSVGSSRNLQRCLPACLQTWSSHPHYPPESTRLYKYILTSLLPVSFHSIWVLEIHPHCKRII